jgi:predicted O-methyltransferase YrrM
MIPSLRYRPPEKWMGEEIRYNRYFFGLVDLLVHVAKEFPDGNLKMIEIGSLAGESTSLFAMSGLFNEIHSIDPWEDYEEFNEDNDLTWEQVIEQYKLNIRYFEDVIYIHKAYSYECSDHFRDDYYDLVYIDGAHDYMSVKKDIEHYLPKIKKGGYISGHDFDNVYPDTIKAVIKTIGHPDRVFMDSSWIKQV